ncbi:MAG TPA: hypothetical protein VIV58_15000 [Kofleriaceae bacterium]
MHELALEQHSGLRRSGVMDPKLQTDVEQALRGGNPDDAARVIMAARHCSLDEARKEISQLLAKRAKR